MKMPWSGITLVNRKHSEYVIFSFKREQVWTFDALLGGINLLMGTHKQRYVDEDFLVAHPPDVHVEEYDWYVIQKTPQLNQVAARGTIKLSQTFVSGHLAKPMIITCTVNLPQCIAVFESWHQWRHL